MLQIYKLPSLTLLRSYTRRYSSVDLLPDNIQLIVQRFVNRNKWIQTPQARQNSEDVAFRTFTSRYNIEGEDAPYDVAVS